MQRLSALDNVICNADRALRALSPNAQQVTKASPADQIDEPDLNDEERKVSAGLMRVNHSGEVCAQALYQGQSFTAKLPEVKQEMNRSADEEIDHLAWCEQRLGQLGSHTSALNPLWYGMSFVIGAAAGLIGDRLSLGFVAATEDQVSEHLQEHLRRLPDTDHKSKAIVEQMLEDEQRHAETARKAGGLEFPDWMKRAMTRSSKLMTELSYRI